ncbi:tyrosine-type recombinase/integrase [Enterobacter ludwigii]|uniref:tyrosine-type recombinase/integrase n=1 Tax=Enterobacter ludwigii TaxID=299767 RepID=UPI003BEF35C1
MRLQIAGKTLSKTFPDMDSAERWANTLEVAKEQTAGKAVKTSESKPKEVKTLLKISDSYIRDVMIVDGVRRGGYDSICNRLDNLADAFTCDIREITKDDVINYITTRKQSVAGGTIRLEVQLLSRVLRWCIPLGYVDCDVTKDVVLPRAGRPRGAILTEQEFERVLSFSTVLMKPIFIIGYETAMRRNEILAIRPYMINVHKSTLKLSWEMTKNGEPRDVPLTDKALNLLKELCEGRDRKSKIFNVKPKSVTRAFKRACTLAGVDSDVCFHSLRHTCITRYAEQDFNALQLQCISGHKDISSLAGYTHVRAEAIAKLMNKK